MRLPLASNSIVSMIQGQAEYARFYPATDKRPSRGLDKGPPLQAGYSKHSAEYTVKKDKFAGVWER